MVISGLIYGDGYGNSLYNLRRSGYGGFLAYLKNNNVLTCPSRNVHPELKKYQSSEGCDYYQKVCGIPRYEDCYAYEKSSKSTVIVKEIPKSVSKKDDDNNLVYPLCKQCKIKVDNDREDLLPDKCEKCFKRTPVREDQLSQCPSESDDDISYIEDNLDILCDECKDKFLADNIDEAVGCCISDPKDPDRVSISVQMSRMKKEIEEKLKAEQKKLQTLKLMEAIKSTNDEFNKKMRAMMQKLV